MKTLRRLAGLAAWPFHPHNQIKRPLRPCLEGRAIADARAAGLPAAPDELARLVDPADLPRLAAALVRTTL